MAGSRFCNAAVLICMLVLPVFAAAEVGTLNGSSRKLLQTMASCSTDFSKADYSSVTSQCTGPDYPQGVCCTAFNSLCAKYKPEVNDLNTLCPIYFLSYLNQAGNYGSGVFMGRCNSGNSVC